MRGKVSKALRRAAIADSANDKWNFKARYKSYKIMWRLLPWNQRSLTKFVAS